MKCVVLFILLGAAVLRAQQPESLTPGPEPAQQATGDSSPITLHPPVSTEEHNGPTARLYRALRSVGLDQNKVFHVREATLERGQLHLYFTDGTIAFTQDVQGRVTGAYFEGEGEVLMRPPDLTERASLGLFSGLGVLDEHFNAAYLRFNHDLEAELKPYLRESEDQENFVPSHDAVAKELAEPDGLRLLASFTEDTTLAKDDYFLHARLATRLGDLDVYDDTQAEDEYKVASLNHSGETLYFDVWMAFPGPETQGRSAIRVIDPASSAEAVPVEAFRIDTTLSPPEMLEATAELDVEVRDWWTEIAEF